MDGSLTNGGLPMKLAAHGARRRWAIIVAGLAASVLTPCAHLSALAAGSPPPNGSPTLELCGIGILAGYFLAYSINHGTKTQDVFKSLLGILGVGAGGSGALLIPKDANDASAVSSALLSYGQGAVIGFLSYAALGVLLAALYSWSGKAAAGGAPAPEESCLTLFADILGRVLLGEDFRAPPPKS